MAGVTTYSCTRCRPIDTKIIEAYEILTNTSSLVSQQEAGRVTAENERVAAEEERTRVFNADHGTASDDHTTAQADHRTAGDDHLLAVADHGTAGDDHTLAAGDHVTAGEDHLASTSATSRANTAAAAAEHMVDIHQGPPGDDGDSAYEIAVQEGFVGSKAEWLASLDGSDGTGIDEVEQTETSIANGGTNKVRITLTDGTYYDIQIKNGSSSNGLFPTSSALSAACPSPKVGDYAFVGDGFPADIYVCETAGTWTDSGDDFDGGSVDLTDYAKKAELSQLEHEVMGNLMSARAKNALMAVFQKVAFTVPDVSDEIAELNNALFNLDELVGIEAEYTQGDTVIWDQGVSDLNDLESGLIVKAVYGDGTKVVVSTGYTLSGTLTVGTSTITVEYQGFTDTFTVTVTQYGSKMSYVISDLSVIAYKFENTGTYKWAITDPSTNRKHAFLTYGITKVKNGNGTESQYYAIPIPKTAVRVTVAITSNTLQVGGYFLKFDENNLLINTTMSSVSYTAGGYSATIDQTGDSDQWYFVVPIKPASGNISSGQPTALSITFSNE